MTLPNDIKYNSHNLTIQAYDEYNTYSAVSKPFEFYIRNQPEIGELTVSNDTVEFDDQVIYVTGSFTDKDNGKQLTFYQHIEGRTEIHDIALEPIKHSNGGDNQQLNFTIKNLPLLETGEYTIYIWANDGEKRDILHQIENRFISEISIIQIFL